MLSKDNFQNRCVASANQYSILTVRLQGQNAPHIHSCGLNFHKFVIVNELSHTSKLMEVFGAFLDDTTKPLKTSQHN